MAMPQKYRLFILGAGFSVNAGMPITSKLLPLMYEVCKSRMQGAVQQFECGVEDFFPEVPFDRVDLEALLTLHESRAFMAGWGTSSIPVHSQNYLTLLKSLLFDVLSQHDPDLRNAYLDFVKCLQPGDMVMTFNWDTILEDALETSGVPFGYDRSDSYSHDPKVVVMKMHGSIDWVVAQDRNCVPSGARLIADGVFQPTGWASAKARRQDQSSYKAPYIVLPSFAKLVSLPPLRQFWADAHTLFAVSDISIIGYSLRPDDFDARSFMSLGLRSFVDGHRHEPHKRINIIDPNRAVLLNYGFVPMARIDYLESGFNADSLGWLKSQLNAHA